MAEKNIRRIVVKVGTHLVTKQDGTLDTAMMRRLVSDIAALRQKGIDTILVSSGAVAAGKRRVTTKIPTDPVEKRQVLAAIGQISLVETYQELFTAHEMVTAQVLLTREDFRDRTHYINIRRCLEALVKHHIVPVLNENDVVAVTEKMFSDNDELAGLVASMMNVDMLIFLSAVDGIYAREGEKNSLIKVIAADDQSWKQCIRSDISQRGRGGMASKCRIAKRVSHLGIQTHIANGQTPHILLDIIHGKNPGTVFLEEERISMIKKWIATSERDVRGSIVVNNGAKEAIFQTEAARSILPVGIVRIDGSFEKGDILEILDEKGERLGLGVAQYGAETAKVSCGKKGKKPLIHYNFLYKEST
ncbi:MAG TPA: glutamate 5-kinase [Candidatus Magasanikbacteria bacterium]|nr:MAG: glutamate 5-kinase [Candidatus Magasanikbacteria bacterium RIFCSPLOWO2_02_FULL_47_16]OGH80017.1 MAG: glutamate 5-kinase [Candidatus Magasanikbacteria bacterium RIFCSPHIGHO2_02_FULL_48_18]HAZ28506.1 glutamate 5-kinase [Candidatus Magasanikbacteria bacterium]